MHLTLPWSFAEVPMLCHQSAQKDLGIAFLRRLQHRWPMNHTLSSKESDHLSEILDIMMGSSDSTFVFIVENTRDSNCGGKKKRKRSWRLGMVPGMDLGDK